MFEPHRPLKSRMGGHNLVQFMLCYIFNLTSLLVFIPVLTMSLPTPSGCPSRSQVLAAAINHAKAHGYCSRGDSIVALHRIGNASVIKIVDIK